VLQHFWFTGKTLLAHDDRIAISVSCPTTFKGAVPNTLLSLLKASRAADIEFLDVGKNNVTIKAASSKLKMPVLPADDFIFKMPAIPEDAEPLVKGKKLVKFIDAVEHCLKSLGEDPAIAEMNGVTVYYNEDHLELFATNHTTISHASISKSKGELQRCILSGIFCKQLVNLRPHIEQKLQSSELILFPDFCYLIAGSIDVWGRLIASERVVVDFPKVFSRNIPKYDLVKIPSKLKAILERAVIVSSSRLEPTKTSLTIRDGRIDFKSESDLGAVADSMPLSNHPDVAIKADAKLMKLGADGAENIVISSNAILFESNDKTFLMSVAE
jgi:DNA polymerase III sliding clamp (beta) subunit (PCNA family)